MRNPSCPPRRPLRRLNDGGRPYLWEVRRVPTGLSAEKAAMVKQVLPLRPVGYPSMPICSWLHSTQRIRLDMGPFPPTRPPPSHLPLMPNLDVEELVNCPSPLYHLMGFLAAVHRQPHRIEHGCPIYHLVETPWMSRLQSPLYPVLHPVIHDPRS
jgi:hypothetical protein